MTISEILRAVADLIDQGNPVDMVSVHDRGVTITVSNFITAARWRVVLDNRPELDADLRLLQRIGVPA